VYFAKSQTPPAQKVLGRPDGWRDEQHPDGTITWTTPSGHVYTTQPGSRLLFPTLSLPTGQLPSACVAS